MRCPTVPDGFGVDRKSKVCYNAPRIYLGVFVVENKNGKTGIYVLLTVIIILLVALLHEQNPDFLQDFRTWTAECIGNFNGSGKTSVPVSGEAVPGTITAGKETGKEAAEKQDENNSGSVEIPTRVTSTHSANIKEAADATGDIFDTKWKK